MLISTRMDATPPRLPSRGRRDRSSLTTSPHVSTVREAMAASVLSMAPMGTNGGADVITVPSPRPR